MWLKSFDYGVDALANTPYTWLKVLARTVKVWIQRHEAIRCTHFRMFQEL